MQCSSQIFFHKITTLFFTIYIYIYNMYVHGSCRNWWMKQLAIVYMFPKLIFHTNKLLAAFSNIFVLWGQTWGWLYQLQFRSNLIPIKEQTQPSWRNTRTPPLHTQYLYTKPSVECTQNLYYPSTWYKHTSHAHSALSQTRIMKTFSQLSVCILQVTKMRWRPRNKAIKATCLQQFWFREYMHCTRPIVQSTIAAVAHI